MALNPQDNSTANITLLRPPVLEEDVIVLDPETDWTPAEDIPRMMRFGTGTAVVATTAFVLPYTGRGLNGDTRSKVRWDVSDPPTRQSMVDASKLKSVLQRNLRSLVKRSVGPLPGSQEYDTNDAKPSLSASKLGNHPEKGSHYIAENSSSSLSVECARKDPNRYSKDLATFDAEWSEQVVSKISQVYNAYPENGRVACTLISSADFVNEGNLESEMARVGQGIERLSIESINQELSGQQFSDLSMDFAVHDVSK